MPKFPKAFGRRKSNGNAFEDIPDVPAGESTFKVFDRSDRTGEGSKSFDGGVKFARAMNASVPRPRTSHLEDDNMFENMGNRGSGASNTHTTSSTDNSSRLSAASTAPSSTDVSGRDEWRSPHDKPFNDIPMPPMPKSASTFSLKNAGRTLSWGRNKPTPPSPPKEETSPTSEDEPANRARAMTTSSYASTATPPKLEKDLGLSLGGDFSEMFSGFGKRQSAVMESNDSKPNSHSPTSRTTLQHRSAQPAPLTIDKTRQIEPSPYSWSSQHSNDRLMLNTSPSPTTERAPPVPQHSTARTPRPGALAESGLRRSSGFSGKRQSTYDSEAVDEDAKLLRESINASRRLNNPETAPRVRDSWALPSASAYRVDDATISSWTTPSTETTPRARKPVPISKDAEEDDLFDDHIAASANAAQRYQERSLSPPTRDAPPKNKVMTPAQFERYRQDQERLRSVGGKPKEEEEEEEEETYDDDDDEAERHRNLAKQRRKQEAHMAVYRQQMMKVTGEAPTGPPVATRPSVVISHSSPNLSLPGISSSDSNEEDDEEVPLGILQAHGFPNKNKPPVRSMGSNPNLRASAQSVAGNPGLPVFARNLPQDPYFGASVVNPSYRESLAFGGGGAASVAGSVSGAPSRGLPPGGLVGVIATEERSRAARRGSPNAQGGYDPPPQNGGFNGFGTPQMQRPGSMMNGMMPGQMGQMGPMPQMGPMMLTPGDQAQIQMTQQMQQFMQMQMQFMQMMAAGQGQANPQMPQMPQMPPQQNGHMSQGSLGSIPIPRPASPLIRPGSSHQQRAMSMLDPNAAPWMQNGHNSMYAPSMQGQGGYAPSIAPSERSNIGLPGRYRPVSHVPQADSKSRASTMSGALSGWENKTTAAATVRAVKPSTGSEEDDEEGWEEMAKKREKKKSKWRSKKGDPTNGLQDMLGSIA